MYYLTYKNKNTITNNIQNYKTVKAVSHLFEGTNELLTCMNYIIKRQIHEIQNRCRLAIYIIVDTSVIPTLQTYTLLFVIVNTNLQIFRRILFAE